MATAILSPADVYDPFPDEWLPELAELLQELGLTKSADPCWKGYEAVGTKTKRGRKVPNCVPKNSLDKTSATAPKEGDRSTKNGTTYEFSRGKSGKLRWHAVKHQAVHASEHLAQNMVSWKAGKVFGGAIAHIASQHGVDPVAAKLLSESVVQAGTATAIYHAQSSRQGEGSPAKTAAYFVAQISAAIAGKMAHQGAEEILTTFHVEDMYTLVGSMMAGKGTGIAVTASAGKTKLHEKAVAAILAKGGHDLKLVSSIFGGKFGKSSGLPEDQTKLVWALTQMGAAMAAYKSRKLKKYAIAGTLYTVGIHSGRIALIKAARKYEGNTRTNAKGTTLHWNEQTKRWHNPNKKQKSKAKTSSVPVIQDTSTLKPKQGKTWLTPKSQASMEGKTGLKNLQQKELEQWLANPPDEYKELFGQIDQTSSRYDELSQDVKDMAQDLKEAIDGLSEGIDDLLQDLNWDELSARVDRNIETWDNLKSKHQKQDRETAARESAKQLEGDAVNRIVPFSTKQIEERRNLVSQIKGYQTELTRLGQEANEAVSMIQGSDSLVDALMGIKQALDETKELRDQLRKQKIEGLERSLKGRLDKFDARVAASYKRVYELLNSRRVVKAPKGTTQREYLDAVEKLVNGKPNSKEYKAIQQKFTTLKPKKKLKKALCKT